MVGVIPSTGGEEFESSLSDMEHRDTCNSPPSATPAGHALRSPKPRQWTGAPRRRASPDLPVPILETALRAENVGPPRGAPPPRVGAGQSLVTVAEDVAQVAGGDADTLPEDAGEAASVSAVDAREAWWGGASGGGDAGGGDTLAGGGGGGGGGDGGRWRESWASGKKAAGSCSVAGPGAAHGSDSGSTEDSSGATVAADSGGGSTDAASCKSVVGASEGGRSNQGAGEGGRGRQGGERGVPTEEASNDATVTPSLCFHGSQIFQLKHGLSLASGHSVKP
ncbi:glycine-rich protein 1-like [Penaeus chinensis]|uniref:glycine-rich protein 1-like n=1 Tax=Penaeus chinensis TaxID=139456 RepID=UPI001FB7FE85|nr:glycine-rich protein 1-like [Penaeus chinensis]